MLNVYNIVLLLNLGKVNFSMKKIFSHSKRFRSLIIIVFAVIIVAAGGLAVGNNETNVIVQPSSAASPGWYCYFGKVNAGAHSGENNITATDSANNYSKFTISTNSDPYFFPGTTSGNVGGGGTSGSINATTNKIAVVRYRTSTAGTIRFYFGASSISGSSGYVSTTTTFNNDNTWHDAVIDLSGYSGWTGTINAFRVDLDGFAATQYVYISFIALFDTTANATSWAGASIKMGTIQTQSGTETVTTENALTTAYFGGTNGVAGTPSASVAGALSKVTSAGSGDFTNWDCIYCVYENGRYRIGDRKTYGSTTGSSGMTVAQWFSTYPTGIVLATQNPAGNAGTSTAFDSVYNYVSTSNYIKISGTTLTVYSLTETEQPTYTTTTVYAPTVTDHEALDTSQMVGTISVTGGSNSTSDYTSAPSTMRFYRSNLSQYLKIDGSTTTMSFSYSGVTAKYAITLNDGSAGYVVPGIAIYYSSDTAAYQNNKDGAIQWTYIPSGGSGTVNFQSSSTISAGSYYDQDVKWDGYTSDLVALDAAVEKGCDKYVYHGSFAHQVLPAGTYKANLEYDVLFPNYVVCEVSGLATEDGKPYDGSNMRLWPSVTSNYTSAGAEISDTEGLITSVPVGTTVYVGFDKSDTSTTLYNPDITGSGSTTDSGTRANLKLYGGWFNLGTVDDGQTMWSYRHIWRMATCVINGVFYEGWIDLHYTNFWDLVAVNNNTDADILTTSSAAAEDLAMVPRKYKNVTPSNRYGEWTPYTHVAASTDDFMVRWSWSFNTEANVKNFTKNYSGTSNAYYTYAQVEYNTNKFVTLTSTAAAAATKCLSMGHVFSSSITRTSVNWSTGTIISPAATGLCQVKYIDPMNVDNHGSTAYMAIVYRSQDSAAATNVVQVRMNERAQVIGASDSNASANITCDGTWRTVVIDIDGTRPWTQTADPDGYDGLRLAELSYMTIRFFSSGNIAGGKSIDLAAIGIFATSAEATAYGTKYIAKNLATQKGSVKAITTSNGTITLAVGGSGTLTDTSLIKNVTAGSTYSVTVTPASGYYCSKLCWRPTGYRLAGMDNKTTTTGSNTYFASVTNGYNATTATAEATKIVEYVDILDSNYINNNMFTGGTSASGWTNSTWGDNVIMTQGQIKAYNAQLVSNYADSDRTDRAVNILDTSVLTALTVSDIQTYINNMCTEANATTYGLTTAYTARDVANVSLDNVKYGVVTTRSNIRNLPTATTYLDSSSHDLVQEADIAYATPVWVLHTSSDGAFYFIQSYNYRGWVDATAIATTASYQEWIEFADPSIRGDVVVTKARYVTINSQKAEMGCVFQHVSTSGSTYTILVPTRDADTGALGSTTATVTTTYASLGYLPYTWNNYVTQAFRYIGTAYSWGSADMGRVDCSGFAATVLKTFGFKMMRNTSQQIGTGYTEIMNSVAYSYDSDNYYDLAKFSGTPMILTGGGHTVLYLGMVDGTHYVIHSPSVGSNVQVSALTQANLEKYCNYTVMVPNNYLEESPLRNAGVAATGSSFTVSLTTPAYGTYSSSTNTTLNGGVDADASSLLDAGTTYVDEFILNAGGRDIYVYAEFEKIVNEVALDIQLQIPDGYGLAGPVNYGSVRYNNNMKSYATVYSVSNGSTKTTRIIAYKGYRLVDIVLDGGAALSTANASVSAAENNGTVDTAITATYTDEVFGNESLTVDSANGPLYPSYNVSDTLKPTADGTITYVIQPTSYTVKYNSNYPSDSGVTATTVTGTHYYNCTGNALEGSAVFSTSSGPGAGWSASKTFSAGSNYKFWGWGTNSTTSRATVRSDVANATVAKNYVTTGTQGATYNLYAKWAPINYSLSVEYVSQMDRELIGTPDGFCVKVGTTVLGNGDVVTSQTPLTIDLSNYGTKKLTNCTASYDSTTGILSINSTATSGALCSVDWTYSSTYNVMTYKYLTITYKLSAGAQSGKLCFATNSSSYNDYTNKTGTTTLNCLYPNWIADNEWHTITINVAEMGVFYCQNQYMTGICFPGSTTSGATLDIASVKLYKNPPTVWGESTTSNSSSSSSTALTTQGMYTFVHTLNKSTAVNVISAQQADYDFVMDIEKAYLFFMNETVSDSSPVYTSTEYTNSGYNDTFGTPASVSINGVSMLGYDVSNYIANHTFDMSAANFTMPDCDVKLVFVCDYVNYEVKVFSYTAGTSYTTIPTTSLVNTAGTASKAFDEATLTIASSKNDGIVGRYGSTVALSVSNIASGKKFVGWYEKNPDSTTTSTAAYGKLVSSDASFTLSSNLHKDMELVAVFSSSTSTNTTFNFRNVSGQVIQTLVAAKGAYIPVVNITAKPFKTGSAFSGWEFLKHADKSKATTTTYNSTTYYLLNGTTQTTYKYDYSILYSDKNCTTPVYIYVNGAGGTVNIDAGFTKLTSSTVKITVSGTGTINGAASATVAYNTTVTATATGTSTFKGWVDMTNPSTRYTPESYKSGSYYYPFISYSKTFSFKATGAMTISPIYASATEAAKMPNVNISAQIQRVNTGTTNRYTIQGMFTADPGTTYTILEWGTLCFVAPDSTTVPTTTSYDTSTGAVTTQNILTTDTVSDYFVQSSNTSAEQANAVGQYAASINIKTAKTVYVRMYCRYSYVDSTTGETVYVVTYSDTYKFTTSAWASSTASAYVTATRWDTVADLNPSDYDSLF